MIDQDRLDELECFRLEDDTPEDARVSLPWRDLRDLVSLIPVVRAAMGIEAATDANDFCFAMQDAVRELRAKVDA